MSNAKTYFPARGRSISAPKSIKSQTLIRRVLLHVHGWWWQSHRDAVVLRAAEHMFYRMNINKPIASEPFLNGNFFIARSMRDIVSHFTLWCRHLGWLEAIKTSLKVLTGSQIFYGVLLGRELVHRAWATRGFCRYYRLEEEAIVMESVWTAPAHRGKGFASAALRETLSILSQEGCRRFYIDTTPRNLASQRMIVKAGFTRVSDREAKKMCG